MKLILASILIASILVVGSIYATEATSENSKSQEIDRKSKATMNSESRYVAYDPFHDDQNNIANTVKQSIATPQFHTYDHHYSEYCYNAGHDDGSGILTQESLCSSYTTTSDGYVNFFETDKRYYEMGDIMEVNAYQDPFDTLLAVEGYYAIWNFESDEPIVDYFIPLNDHTLSIRLSEDRFDSAECYYVYGGFNTSRAFEDEALDWHDFCIVESPNTEEIDDLPEPEPEPEPQTGIQGKVYTDTNNNDRYDAGEPLLSGMSVVSINLSDHSDTERDRTDSNGEYFIERDAGSYLVQVESTNSFAYLDVRAGSVTTQNLGIP